MVLALAALAVLAQSGQKCVTVAGTRVCGYECAGVFGKSVPLPASKAQDAKGTAPPKPDGSCDTGGPGKPVCFDPPVRGGSSACLEAAAAR